MNASTPAVAVIAGTPLAATLAATLASTLAAKGLPLVYFSANGEDFEHQTATAALEAMMDTGEELEAGVTTLSEADCAIMCPEDFDHCTELALEDMEAHLYDEVGDAADADFTRVSPEAKAELRDAIRAWIGKHVEVSRFWRVTAKPRTRLATEAEIAATMAKVAEDQANLRRAMEAA